jgi:hypothetical protein
MLAGSLGGKIKVTGTRESELGRGAPALLAHVLLNLPV